VFNTVYSVSAEVSCSACWLDSSEVGATGVKQLIQKLSSVVYSCTMVGSLILGGAVSAAHTTESVQSEAVAEIESAASFRLCNR
jgi:hypothetical protein